MLEQEQKLRRRVVEITSMEDLVPKDYLLRKIDAAVDFTQLYDLVGSLYCPNNGRPSVDPVVLFKIVLIQHLFGIPSLRRTVSEIRVNIAYRWFLGYALNDDIPHFSTVSHNFCDRFKEETKESVAVARSHGVYMHTHLGEGEYDTMLERWGKRTIDWCADTGFIGPDVWYAHGCQVLPEEYAMLASAGTGIAHCCSAIVGGGMNVLDLKGLSEAGVCVSLGCDGCASNDGSNPLDNIRVAYLMQAFHSKRRGGCVSPNHVLKAATVNGAKTLDRPELGSLEEGKAADLFMVDTSTLEMAGALHDPKNMLPKIGVTGNVYLTMINGKVVYKDGQLTNVDERKLARKCEEVAQNSLRSKLEIFSIH